MITEQLIEANESLKELTAEQKTAIVNLSKNDEEEVIGRRFGEVYRKMDETIKTSTGIERNGDEKTYNYLERAAKAIAEKAQKFETDYKTANKERERLQKVIDDGGVNEEQKKALQQAQKDVISITKQYNDLKKEFDGLKSQHESEITGIRIDAEINEAKKALKVKKEYPDSVISLILDNAVRKVKGMNPEYVDDGKGGKVLVFKGEDGEIKRNSENQLNPYTAAELLENELRAIGVLEEKRIQQGGGTKPTGFGNSRGVAIDLAGVKTQEEAYEVISQSLFAKGLTNGSKDFQKELDEAWKNYKVSELPKR